MSGLSSVVRSCGGKPSRLGESLFGTVSLLTNWIKISILGRGDRVVLGEKKLSIEWEVLCEPPSGEGSGLPPEGAGSVPWEHSDYAAGAYAVDVYLTE